MILLANEYIKYNDPTLSIASDIKCVYRLFRHMLVLICLNIIPLCSELDKIRTNAYHFSK